MLIRDLPAEVHAELVRRAAAADTSLRAYLSNVLAQHVATPSTSDWLKSLEQLSTIITDGQSGADLIAAARADDDALVGR